MGGKDTSQQDASYYHTQTQADTASGSTQDQDPYEISKRQLLEETGISYGQLYRWKREGLIPDEWFEKRSAFTGQETFFPRAYILERINVIQSMKDTHSLTEIRDHIINGTKNVGLGEVLAAMPGLNQAMVDALGLDLDTIVLSEVSLKALSTLLIALEKAQASKKTVTTLVAQTITALDISNQTPHKKG